MNPIQCLEKLVAENEIAGAALRVRQNGNVLCEAALGYADIGQKKPVSTDTVFRLASMTKPVIGIAIMQLAERGKLGIEDRVEKYIPAYKDMLVAKFPENTDLGSKMHEAGFLDGLELIPANKSLTIGMLLSHSGGMAQGPVGMRLLDALKSVGGMEQRINNLAHLPLDFQPGEDTGYSAAAAFDTLGRIIEIVSGKDLNSYLHENIFSPLGIRDVSFLLDNNQQGRLAHVYEFTENKVLRDVSNEPGTKIMDAAMEKGYFSGSGGLYGSLNGFERISCMLAGRGALDGAQILSPGSIKLMTTPYGPRQPMPGMDWGLSVAVFEGKEKGRWLGKGSFGWSGAFGTHFYVDPENNLCTTLMLNRSNLAGALSHISLAVEEAVYKTYI